ncbi:MAG TPA: glycosyltransferase family 39 protein [Gemmataceae bacterium]|nr:glycosyltransferase family 39 protein [Gemmataceae bacterium]
MRVPAWIFVSLLFLGAFGVRFGAVLAFRDIHEGPSGAISNDDVQFYHLALNLVQGYGYRVTPDRPLTSFRAPGFPFALAGLYAIVGDSARAAYVLFCILGATACVLTYLLAREILSENAARIAGVLAAIYLPHVYMATTFNSESLYVPLLALGLWLAVRYCNGAAWWNAALAGLTLGCATLTRPAALLMLPLFVGVFLWNDWKRPRTPTAWRLNVATYALFTLAFVGVILPWTWRNHEVHGKWIPVATNGGTTFWGGNNDRVLHETRHLGYWVPSTELPDRDQIDAAKNEVERDEIEWRLGKTWVREHLASMPLLEAYKFARLWWLPDYGEGKRWLRIVSYLPFLLLFGVFAVRCLWRSTCWTPSWLILHASMLAVIATALIFCGEPRYRDANLPVLMIYAASALVGARMQIANCAVANNPPAKPPSGQ